MAKEGCEALVRRLVQEMANLTFKKVYGDKEIAKIAQQLKMIGVEKAAVEFSLIDLISEFKKDTPSPVSLRKLKLTKDDRDIFADFKIKIDDEEIDDFRKAFFNVGGIERGATKVRATANYDDDDINLFPKPGEIISRRPKKEEVTVNRRTSEISDSIARKIKGFDAVHRVLFVLTVNGMATFKDLKFSKYLGKNNISFLLDDKYWEQTWPIVFKFMAELKLTNEQRKETLLLVEGAIDKVIDTGNALQSNNTSQ